MLNFGSGGHLLCRRGDRRAAVAAAGDPVSAQCFDQKHRGQLALAQQLSGQSLAAQLRLLCGNHVLVVGDGFVMHSGYCGLDVEADSESHGDADMGVGHPVH